MGVARLLRIDGFEYIRNQAQAHENSLQCTRQTCSCRLLPWRSAVDAPFSDQTCKSSARTTSSGAGWPRCGGALAVLWPLSLIETNKSDTAIWATIILCYEKHTHIKRHTAPWHGDQTHKPVFSTTNCAGANWPATSFCFSSKKLKPAVNCGCSAKSRLEMADQENAHVRNRWDSQSRCMHTCCGLKYL